MKKHTMQEVANFFGCYIAKDKNDITWIEDKNNFNTISFYNTYPRLGLDKAQASALFSDGNILKESYDLIAPNTYKLIKHTMQEIADFFECYVLQTHDLIDIAPYFVMCDIKPSYKEGNWDLGDTHILINFDNGDDFISDINNCNFKKLVIPKSLL